MKFIKFETEQKLRGGYYTPKYLADFINEWVSEIKPLNILEPSCGDGIFFKSLKDKVNIKESNILGIELDKLETIKAEKILNESGFSNAQILSQDFLKWTINHFNNGVVFDAVVGNPPFIRYQYLTDETQSYIEAIFQSLKLKFTKHTNIWVPFVLSAVNFLRPGGRLGMVVPAEILHVMHAQSLRTFLGNNCSKILIFDPEDIWFQNTLQGAVILFAEKKKDVTKISDGLGIVKTNGHSFTLTKPKKYFNNAIYINGKTVEGKWTYALLNKVEYQLIDKLKNNDKVYKFDDIAKVDVGIVTGANKFFLVDDLTVKKYNLERYSHLMFGRSEHCPGVIYDENQNHINKQKGLPTNFIWFDIENFNELNQKQQEYVLYGEKENLHTRYKCRMRAPWFKVPSVYSTDIGMLKRAHEFPRLLLNKINAYTTDTAYRIKSLKFENNLFVYCFINSLTALTAELEGRHYGGGVLELVPSEIEKLLIPISDKFNFDLLKLNKQFLNKDNYHDIVFNQDKIILKSIGLTKNEIEILQNAWLKLKRRRQRTSN